MPSFSISIVKLTEGWAWFRVFRKSVAVVMLGIIVRVSSPCIDCLVNEMLYIKQLTPSLNVQTDSIRAKVFV